MSGKPSESRIRPRRYQEDPWSRGREVARGVVRCSPKPEKMPIFCHRRGIKIFGRLFSTQQRPHVLYQTPGRRPPRITGGFMNTATRGRVGAPDERAPLRFHGGVVGFVDRCLLGLGISPVRINICLRFSQADLDPTSAQPGELFFRFFF